MDMANTGGKSVPDATKYPEYNDYVVADLGLSYRYQKNYNFALTVNNLFDKEFYDWTPSLLEDTTFDPFSDTSKLTRRH